MTYLGITGSHCQRCSKTGKRTPITQDLAKDSLEEFGFFLCQPCCEAGRLAGKSNKVKPEDPRKSVLRKYQRRINECKTAKDVSAEANSYAIDGEVTTEMGQVIMKYLESRLMEIEIGAI